MDNPNNTNPNSSNPFSPLPDASTPPPPAPAPPPPPPPLPFTPPPPPPAQTDPTLADTVQPANAGWPAANPWSPPPPPAPETSPVNPPMPSNPEPVPTFTPAEPVNPPAQTMSSLDNPWDAPLQPPPLDGPAANFPPTPPPIPSAAAIPPMPAYTMNTSAASELTGVSGNPEPAAAAPTDFSHLLSPNQPETPAASTLSSGGEETMVTPLPVPEIPTMPTENHKTIPRWLIGGGIGLLIIVAVASAYFILGIGQPPKTPTSIPATTQTANPPAQNAAAAPLPVATPTTQPAATGSANFSNLQGSGTQPASSSGSTAIDTLRQRQQQQGH